MKTLKLLLAGLVVGVAIVALRDRDGASLLAPAGRRSGPAEADGEEPVLGYDGMDQETLLDWLSSASLDRETLERIHAYEQATRGREEVLLAVGDMVR